MNRQLIMLFCTVLLAAVLFPACKQSGSVVSEKWIQKRKYRSGWFVDVPSRKKKENSDVVHVQNDDSASPARVQAVNRIHASLPSLQKSRMDLKHRQVRKALPFSQKQMLTVTSAPTESRVTEVQPEVQGVFTDEEEESETPEALSMVAKLLAVMSGLLAVITVVAVFIFIFGSSSLSSTGVIVLVSMGVLAVIGILLSLLLSYIIMEKYNDDVPMQWTLFASYVFEAIIAVLAYGFLGF